MWGPANSRLVGMGCKPIARLGPGRFDSFGPHQILNLNQLRFENKGGS